jgi:hypothetical protein
MLTFCEGKTAALSSNAGSKDVRIEKLQALKASVLMFNTAR